MKSSNVLLGVLGAAALGATLGVLFAPKKGSETRKEVANGVKDLADTTKSNIDSVINEVSEKFTTLKNDGKELVAKGKEKINTVIKEA